MGVYISFMIWTAALKLISQQTQRLEFLYNHKDSEEYDELEALNKKPYVPEEFADFTVYNASLENREWLSSKGDFVNSRYEIQVTSQRKLCLSNRDSNI
nr:PREDICTED: kinesin-like protein KIF13A isoform X2 [Anolis carolinensis]|eukprot:XP_016848419.1 PREDICTED: kinesin-like protein KIF13A isoform X2 [Anolis carolinensis]